MGYLPPRAADMVRRRLGIKPPRSSFMIDPMGEAAVSTIESPPIIALPPVHPIYQMPPTPAPTAPAAPAGSISLIAPNWFWYAALGGVVYYWWFRKKEP